MPLITTGFLIRIGLILLIIPDVQLSLFVPFFEAFYSEPTLDPWKIWLSLGQSPQSFPYGFVTFYIFLPFTMLGYLLDPFLLSIGLADPNEANLRGIQIGFAITILVLDAALFKEIRSLYLIIKESKNKFEILPVSQPKYLTSRFITYFYWLSPIVLYINYIHGQIDVLPTFLIIYSSRLLALNKAIPSAILIVLAIFAKLSVLLLVPFFVIYIFYSPRGYSFFRAWAGVFTLSFFTLSLIILMAPGQLQMVMQNSELANTFTYGFTLPNGSVVMIFLLAYFASLSILIILAPLDQLSTYKIIGATLLVLVTSASNSIGWYLWIVPFTIIISLQFSERFRVFLQSFWLLAILLDWSSANEQLVTKFLFSFIPLDIFQTFNFDFLKSSLASLAFCFSLLLAIRILKDLLNYNLPYRLANKPILIGIAGDSSVGKDTLTYALSELVAKNRSTTVLGDDYHAYPRGARIWKTISHLNPKANHLHQFSEDVKRLSAGESAYMHHYDHDTGTFTKPRDISPASLTIVNGLHSLYPTKSIHLYDLRIFMDMDESLRRSLKVKRDTEERNVKAHQVIKSIESRYPDGQRYIAPQATNADLVFSIRPILDTSYAGSHIGVSSTDLNHDYRLCLDVTLPNSLDIDALKAAFECFASIPVVINKDQSNLKTTLTFFASSLSTHDTQVLMSKLLGPMKEFLDVKPNYKSGFQGTMQIICLVILEQTIDTKDKCVKGYS